MVMRPAVVRRRPLLRAAAVGGTFAAGRAMGRRAGQQSSAEADQSQGSSGPESSQPAGAPSVDQGVHAPAQGQPGAGSSMMEQLNQLTAMHDQGALSDEEFEAAKAKILGS